MSVETVPDELAERIAQIPWNVQQLPDEDAWEHRVRVVQDVLKSVERAEDELYGVREMVEPQRPAEFKTDREWASFLWGRMHQALDETEELQAALSEIDRALRAFRESQERA